MRQDSVKGALRGGPLKYRVNYGDTALPDVPIEVGGHGPKLPSQDDVQSKRGRSLL